MVNKKISAIEATQRAVKSTNYDTISVEYKKSKQQPWRLHIELFSMFELLGDITGKSVLDLACGEGFFTRMLKHHGAGRVVGVDISEKMIALARNQEAESSLGIEYIQEDVKQLRLQESFDVVVAGYLLNYASTKEELVAMCQAISRHMNPGAKFVTVNNNPFQKPEYFKNCKQYGFEKIITEELHEGTPITWRFFLESNYFDIVNYQLSGKTHEDAFLSAGLTDIVWHQPQLSPEETSRKDYWQAFFKDAPIIFIECTKPLT